MLFNSLSFIFGFLPLTLLVWSGLARLNRRWALIWLALASLGFFGWWEPRYLLILLGSIGFNYGAARAIDASTGRRAQILMIIAIALDLGLLGWFKYADFLGASFAALAGLPWSPLGIPLPLGISFFTFTQIAFLIDTARGKAREPGFVNYVLFVSFFPHLLAGPVLHHAEMMPQFNDPAMGRLRGPMLSTGLTLFLIGLAKKTILADGVAPPINAIFDNVAAGLLPGTAEAWVAALGYSFQLYFDFSGYSDMALGASRLFGIILPLNFASPYQACSPAEFWHRWHMSLSRFLRDYLYIPLGGNRRGDLRRSLNLFLTMVLGGLWHGAAWTFVAWGAWHGLWLIGHHGLLALGRVLGLGHLQTSRPARFFGWASTFLIVVIGWVLFRAQNFTTFWRLVQAMAGIDGGHVAAFIPGPLMWGQIAILAGIALLAPNSQTITLAAPAEQRFWSWRPSPAWLVLMLASFIASLCQMSDVSPFLYYRF